MAMTGELLGFLKKKDDWYEPNELLSDIDFLSATQMHSGQIADVEPHVIGSYYGTQYAIDERDGFAKPVDEFRR